MFSDPMEHHEMVLETSFESGADQWFCPQCGRRLLLHWPPNYKKIVLEPGDEYAVHSAGKGGVNRRSTQVTGSEEAEFTLDEQVQVEEESLKPYLEWLDKVDFEGLWNRETGDES